MSRKVQPIDTSLPPDIQLQMHAINSTTLQTIATERTKSIALIGLVVIGTVITGGSVYLASLKLPTPEFLAPVFASIAATIALPLTFHMGRIAERKQNESVLQ